MTRIVENREGVLVSTLAAETSAGAADAGRIPALNASGLIDLTMLSAFTSVAKGVAPLSGGGTVNYLRADGSWAAPPGAAATVADGDYGDITVSGVGTAWAVDAGVVTLAKMADLATDRLIGRDTAGTGVPESLTVSGGIEFTGAGGIQSSAFTGDATKTAGGTALTLASVIVAGGPIGSATVAPIITYDAKGRLTTVTSTTITPAASSITGGAALTKVDDTNVTATLGGSPTTALLAAASITLGWTGTLGVARGGTNIASYAVGDIIYASGATTLAKLADVATGNALISGGVGVAPSWGKIGLTTHVTALTASRALVSDVSGFVSVATTTSTEIGYVNGVTSAIQTQIDGKQPLDSDLTTIAGLTATTDNFIVSVASAWASRTPAQVRTTLALVIGTNVQAWDADLDTWATITPAANVGAFLADPTSAKLAAAVTDETGSGALVFGTTPTLATPVINGLPTGTGVAAAATASTLVSRDASGNTSVNNLVEGYTSTATAAGTTTLTITATYTQVFTGTTTQTVKLPTTSVLQGQQYLIINQSTGLVTVQSSGGNTVIVLGAGTYALFEANTAAPTTAAHWDCQYAAVSVSSGKVGVFLNSLVLAGTDGSSVAFGAGGTVLYTGAIGVTVQAYDADLAALAANSTNGLWAHTGAGTGSARTLTGTANQITVTDGDGVSGNPTFATPQNIHTAATPQFAQLGLGKAPAANNLIDAEGTLNGSLSFVLKNLSAASGANTRFMMMNDVSSLGQFGIYGSTTTPYGPVGSNTTYFYSNTTLAIVSDGGSDIRFGVGNAGFGGSPTTVMEISGSGTIGAVKMNIYGAGIATFSSSGVISSTATTGSGSVVLATSPTLVTPILGTPTSGNLANCTGLPIAGLVNSTSAALGLGSIELGHASDTTIARVSAGVVSIEGANIIVSGGAGGTPSSLTLTNATGLPIAGLVASTATAIGVGSVELGHASDTTIARVSAGVVSIEGVNVVTISSTDTLTNKTLTTPVINGLPTGTGIAAAATASTLMSRDANANSAINNLEQAYTTTATAAGTTTLTITATYSQIFTGSSTQTVKLPTTSVLQGHQHYIDNQSTGAVTVQSSGANTIVILAGGTSALFTAQVATPTTAANWGVSYFGASVASGKKLTASNSITLAGTDATTMTFPTTSATIARTDAANTFTGLQTFSNNTAVADAGSYGSAVDGRAAYTPYSGGNSLFGSFGVYNFQNQDATVSYGVIGSTGLGYATTAGSTVTQATSKATGVTLNNVCGAITMNNAALAANTGIKFTFTNSAIAAHDCVHVWLKSGFTSLAYIVYPEGNAAGSRGIVLRNISAGSLSEAVVIGFAIFKAVVS